LNDLSHTYDAPLLVSRAFLKVAPENPRSEDSIDAGQLEDLMASIAENGILTPLIGYQQGVNFYITAGGRRVRALQALDETETGEIAAPVIVMEKADAIHAGNAEQLAHVAMDDVDELRLFQLPAYVDLPDAQLAARLGRSPRYVGQRREILRLPEPMVVDVLNRNLTMDQAIGLTYAKLYPETQADFYQRALKDRRFDADDMRNALRSTVRPWASYCHAQLVTRDNYIAAGGKLQEDLFTGDPLVLDPQILLQLATERARDLMKERYPDAFFITEADEDTRLYDIPTHRGIWGLDEAESKEWHEDLSWWAMSRAEKAAEPDENGDVDEEAVDRLVTLQARRAELEPRAAYLYPEPLAELLGVAWKLNDGPMRDAYGELRDPLAVREHVMPTGYDDLEKLRERGFLDKPAEKEAAKEVALEDKISVAHKMRIDRIRTHALRMELSKDVDGVLRLFAQHLSGPLGRSVVFAIDPDKSFHPDPDMAVTYSTPWMNMEQLGQLKSEEVMALKDKDVRAALAFRVLSCLTLRSPQAQTLDPATVRRWWTPDATFLSAYSKPQLLAMIKPLRPEDDFSKEKRFGIAEALARVVEKQRDWLPFGF
jgi:ParB/RepB/Spo0J family partition protein